MEIKVRVMSVIENVCVCTVPTFGTPKNCQTSRSLWAYVYNKQDFTIVNEITTTEPLLLANNRVTPRKMTYLGKMVEIKIKI